MKKMISIFIFCMTVWFLGAEEITFTYEPPAENAVRLVKRVSHVEMVLSMPDPSTGEPVAMEMENLEQYDIRETVLGVKNERISELKVEYLDVKKTDMQFGKTNVIEVPVKGKTYLVDRGEEKPRITNEKGNQVPDEEHQIVNKDYGKEENKEIIDKLDGASFTVGDRIELMETAIQESFQKKFKDGTINDTTVVLEEIRVVDGFRCAIFSLKFLLSAVFGPLVMSVDFGGELIIVIDKAWVLELIMDGPITFSSVEPKRDEEKEFPPISGNGRMSVALRYNYKQP